MKRTYTTANGKQLNIDAIIARNEETIAVGNMKVNARGDQLGPGGIIETPKSQMMADYYKLNTPVAVDVPLEPRQQDKKKMIEDDWIEPVVTAQQEETAVTESQPKLRGNLADSISKAKLPEKEIPPKTGPTRI